MTLNSWPICLQPTGQACWDWAQDCLCARWALHPLSHGIFSSEVLLDCYYSCTLVGLPQLWRKGKEIVPSLMPVFTGLCWKLLAIPCSTVEACLAWALRTILMTSFRTKQVLYTALQGLAIFLHLLRTLFALTDSWQSQAETKWDLHTVCQPIHWLIDARCEEQMTIPIKIPKGAAKATKYYP